MSTFHVDLHVHTSASPDGRSPLEDVARAARRAGLDAVAITDHNLCTPLPEALEGVLLIPGCEVSTKIGHITGLFLERPLEDLGRLPEPERAVEAIRAAGGLAVLAHPYQRPGAQPEAFAFPLDGIEAANARAALKVPDANARAAALAHSRGLPLVGGSDAHDAAEVGSALTVLEAETLSVPALRAALAAGGSGAVLRRNTSHFRKGLSQWTKARRQGGGARLAKAGAYVACCAGRDVFRLAGAPLRSLQNLRWRSKHRI